MGLWECETNEDTTESLWQIFWHSFFFHNIGKTHVF